MRKPRRHFQGADKVAILKRHLVEKVPVSDLCDEFGVHPNQVYDWLKKFFENARRIVDDYVEHYNTVRLHSATGYVTPKDILEGRAEAIFAERDRKLAAAREHRQQMRQKKREPSTPTPQASQPAIEFRAVRAAVTMTAVLTLLGLQARGRQGDQQRGPCPLHGSSTCTSRCFSAHLDQNIIQCFKCGRVGNALDLWAQANRKKIYEASVDLCQRLNIPLPILATPN
jgi:transposase-like protein